MADAGRLHRRGHGQGFHESWNLRALFAAIHDTASRYYVLTEEVTIKQRTIQGLKRPTTVVANHRRYQVPRFLTAEEREACRNLSDGAMRMIGFQMPNFMETSFVTAHYEYQEAPALRTEAGQEGSLVGGSQPGNSATMA